MRRAVGIAMVMTVAAACAKQAPATATPADDAAAAPEPGAAGAEDMAAMEPEGAAAGLDDLQQELAGLEQQLQVRGVELPPSALEAQRQLGVEGATEAAETDPAARCERICDLAEATCDLEGRICALADEHPTERRYADVCGRAQDDCARANEACEGCS